MIKTSKFGIATAVAILFHTIGLLGILFFDKTFFIRSTLFNLILMLVLLLWTQNQRTSGFYLFIFLSFSVGICAEMIGVNTGWLFGHYRYGTVLGPRLAGTPLMIGLNWFTVVYGAGNSMLLIYNRFLDPNTNSRSGRSQSAQALLVVLGGAALAVAYDWIMEPAAVSLGYWAWLGNGSIPAYNYICWFIVACLLLSVFYVSKFEKSNKFAVNLIVIQLLFFLLLRLFLP